jgi:hypothetical protein
MRRGCRCWQEWKINYPLRSRHTVCLENSTIVLVFRPLDRTFQLETVLSRTYNLQRKSIPADTHEHEHLTASGMRHSRLSYRAKYLILRTPVQGRI